MDAVVLWHEMNHILEGKTYIDTVFISFNPTQINMFKMSIRNELIRRKSSNIIPDLTVPPFYFSAIINSEGNTVLDESTLQEALSRSTVETLNGLLKQANLS